MPNTIRIKRSTATAAPTTLQNAELAYSELSNKLFYGVGTGGAGGSATSIVAIGGSGAFTDLTTDQTVAGVKTFSSSPIVPTLTSSDSSTKAASTAFVKGQGYLISSDLTPYLTTSAATSTFAPISSPTFTGTVTIPAGASISGYLTSATAATTYSPIASPTFTGVPAAPTATADTNTTQIATTAYVVGQGYLKSSTASATYAPIASPTFTGTVTIPAGASISGYLTTASASTTYQTQAGMSSYLTTASASTTYAPIASPTFTGTPLVPTATAGTNTTQAASTAFVQTAVSNLVASAPAALDTLNELAAALGNDANFATTISTSIGTKLSKASNLSDLLSVATARTNLGLGSMAVQNASSVAITGGTIDGVTFDGGTF